MYLLLYYICLLLTAVSMFAALYVASIGHPTCALALMIPCLWSFAMALMFRGLYKLKQWGRNSH